MSHIQTKPENNQDLSPFSTVFYFSELGKKIKTFLLIIILSILISIYLIHENLKCPRHRGFPPGFHADMQFTVSELETAEGSVCFRGSACWILDQCP